MAPPRSKTSGLSSKIADDGSLTVYAKVGKSSVPVATVPANVVRHYVDDVEPGTDDDNDNDNDKGEGGGS